MPIFGYKKEFKNLETLRGSIFTVNFNLKYNEHGFLRIKDEKNNYFDCGDTKILLDKIFDELDEKIFKEYDNGVYILSVCKYIVDKVPNLYSINFETKGNIDTYYKQEIIDDYNKIKNL